MTLLATVESASVHHCDWRDLVSVVADAGGCDLLCADTPYSARVHDGHDGQVYHLVSAGIDDMRRGLGYSAWTGEDVRQFVEAWHPLTRGWFVTITDHILARAWETELERVERYVFAPLPFFAPGSRVRMLGDGPSCWTTWIVVARRRTSDAQQWGTLPGGYVLPPGHGGAMPIVGGKPVWLMQRIVEDYSRPSALVVDPCCGAGTTAIGALRSGRRAIVGDVSEEHAQIASMWIKHPHRPAPNLADKLRPGQGSLFNR